MFDDRHCVAMLQQHISFSYRVAVHLFFLCRARAHFFFYRVAVHNVGVQQCVAQVYTRDATHRPTATWTPGRGISRISKFFVKFLEISEKSEKSRKKSKKGGFQLELEGGFRGKCRRFFRKFRVFFEKTSNFTKNPPPPPKPRKTPFFTAQPRRNPRELSQNRAKTGGRGGGSICHFWKFEPLEPRPTAVRPQI